MDEAETQEWAVTQNSYSHVLSLHPTTLCPLGTENSATCKLAKSSLGSFKDKCKRYSVQPCSTWSPGAMRIYSPTQRQHTSAGETNRWVTPNTEKLNYAYPWYNMSILFLWDCFKGCVIFLILLTNLHSKICKFMTYRPDSTGKQPMNVLGGTLKRGFWGKGYFIII